MARLRTGLLRAWRGSAKNYPACLIFRVQRIIHRHGWVKPFFITAHNLDALEKSGDVWGKIEASFYYRIPNGKVIDETGITDSVEINREACLPCWEFEEFKSNFKDGLSTTAYMARQMEKGVKFTELMEDKELCPNITYYGEERWGK